MPITQVMARCASSWRASSWFSHPGFTSSWLHIILAPWMKVSKSPGARMPKGRSLYLLKLVPRILIQTCCSSISHILARVSTYRNTVKRMVGWVTISHYNFTLLQVPTVNLSSISMEVRWLYSQNISEN